MINEASIEKGFQQVWQMFQETDRRIARSIERTNRAVEEANQAAKEASQAVKETSLSVKETDRKFEKYFGKLKELDRNWGKLVEALVKPSMAEQFRRRGIPIIGSGQRVERKLNGNNIEIDILLTNTNVLIAVEVKTNLTVAAVDEHINKHLKPFKLFFPEYRDKKLYGAVAYIHLEENADRCAYKKGLFVLTFSEGDRVTIQNDANFKPTVWEGTSRLGQNDGQRFPNAYQENKL